MLLTENQLFDLIAEASYRFNRQMQIAYNDGTLEIFLENYLMQDLIPKEENSIYESFADGNILVVGGTYVKETVLTGCAKKLGINKDRLELYLDYSDGEKFDFKKIQYNPKYRLIFVGPMSHSGISKGDNSSIITAIENMDGLPKIIKLMDSNELKITKTNFKNALEEEIRCGYLEI